MARSRHRFLPPVFRFVALRLAALTFATFAAFTAPRALAHDLKLSVSEAIYNRDTERLEVALRTYPDDLEGLLTSLAGKEVPLDQPDEVAKVITPYLIKTWQAKPLKGAARPLVFTGMDATVVDVWLFFEVPLPGGVIGASLKNTFMQEAFVEQLNTVRIRDGKTKITLSFPPGTGERIVEPPAPATPPTTTP